MSDNQDRRKRRSLSPIYKQIMWTGGIALLLILGITFLIIRPHYVKIQDEITGQRNRIQRDLQTLKRKNTKTINTLENEKKELQETVSNLQTAQQKYRHRIHKLNQEMESLNAQIQSLENEQKDLKTVQADLEAEKSKLKTELSKLEKEKTDLDDELRRLKLPSGQMAAQEKGRPAGIQYEKADYVSGKQIIVHCAKGEEEKVRQIMDQLSRLGARVQLETHKASEVDKHKNTLYYYKGNETAQAAWQIQDSLSEIASLQIVELKVWWFWIDMNKLNLWL
jgi:chromosome segregation ATPase